MGTGDQTNEVPARLHRALGRVALESARDTYRAALLRLAERVPARAVDVRYGPDERLLLDIYTPRDAGSPAPIMLWVHGGGHVAGGKGGPDDPFEANVGRFAAANGNFAKGSNPGAMIADATYATAAIAGSVNAPAAPPAHGPGSRRHRTGK